MGSRLITALVACLSLSACVSNISVGATSTGNNVPPPISLNLSRQCTSVNGLYANAGTALRVENKVQNPRLAHSLFRLALLDMDGGSRLPHSVQLEPEPDGMTLRVVLIGEDSTREWSTDFECEEGWLHVRDHQETQYLGDGVTQQWAKMDVWLAVDVEGNLVAHVIGEAEDHLFLGGRHRSRAEDWYLFRRQNAD